MADVKRWTIGLVKFAVAAVLLGVLVKIFVDNFGQIRVYVSRLDWRFVAGAAAIQAVMNWTIYELWLVMIRRLGGRIGRRPAWKAFFLPYFARYVPGKVALVAGKVHYCTEEGIPARKAVVSILVENALVVIPGLSLAALSSFYLFRGLVSPALSASLLVVAVLLLCSLHPAVLRRVLSVPMRLFGRKSVRSGELLNSPTILAFFVGYAALWPLGGLVYGLAAAALDPGLLSRVITVGAAFVTASSLGQATMLAPAGLGVREGALYLLLEGETGPALAVAAVALARLITVLVDIAFAAVTPLVTGRRKSR
ncbi:MAG: flippase-like domain-containing protein [Candidatus Coatesbacteria bacterium]|nr:MAG: flippase-like domain-containing protein [Candidatus Coatesbacteria bacterium]